MCKNLCWRFLALMTWTLSTTSLPTAMKSFTPSYVPRRLFSNRRHTATSPSPNPPQKRNLKNRQMGYSKAKPSWIPSWTGKHGINDSWRKQTNTKNSIKRSPRPRSIPTSTVLHRGETSSMHSARNTPFHSARRDISKRSTYPSSFADHDSIMRRLSFLQLASPPILKRRRSSRSTS
jgi:hypothetical protein